MRKALFIFILFAIFALDTNQPLFAKDEEACVSEFLGQTTQLSDDEINAALILSKVARSVGVTRKITAVPCYFATQAFGWRASEAAEGVPKGDYIIYQPDWVRQVLGTDEMEAVALFGHELGHFLNDDFNTNNETPNAEMERRADKFAGCAVARMGGELSKIDDLLSRLRSTAGGTYPTRLASLDAAKEGFSACTDVKVDAKVDPPKNCGNTFEGLVISGANVATSMPENSKNCFTNVTIQNSQIGVEIRERLKLDVSQDAFSGEVKKAK